MAFDLPVRRGGPVRRRVQGYLPQWRSDAEKGEVAAD